MVLQPILFMKEPEKEENGILGEFISELLRMEHLIQNHVENGEYDLIEGYLHELINLSHKINHLVDSNSVDETQKIPISPIGFLKPEEALEEYRNSIIRIDHIVSSKPIQKKKNS